MARYKITSPDGQNYEITAPDEASQEQVLSYAQEQFSQPKIASQPSKDEASLADKIAASPITQFFTGAASPIMGAASLIEEGTFGTAGGRERAKALEEMETRGGSGGAGGAAKLAGTVLSPAFLAAAKLAPAASYGGRVLQGSELGALAGLTAPKTDEGSRLDMGAVGAGVGGVIPALAPVVAGVGKGLYHAGIEPWLNNAAIKGRAFLEAAGDKADDIIRLLKENKQIVPGAAPTAGEAAVPAASAEFSALQKGAERALPSQYLARSDAQNAARLEAIKSVGQTPEALAAAQTARAKDAALNYGEAFNSAAKIDPALAQLTKNPYVKDAIPDAVKLANAEGITAKTDLIKFLHFTKLSLDKQLAKTGDTALSAAEKTQVYKAKKELVSWMADKSKSYDKARMEFAKASKPINQMEVGQFLEKKLVPALGDEAKQKASTYAQALRDAEGTIKKATGGPRFESLDKVLTPEQLKVVNSVRDDLARGARFEDMAKRGTSNIGDIASESMEREFGGRFPNILHRGAMIANAVVRRLEGKINKKLAVEIAADMLNPPKVGESIEQALARQKKIKIMSSAIMQYRPAAVAGTISASQ